MTIILYPLTIILYPGYKTVPLPGLAVLHIIDANQKHLEEKLNVSSSNIKFHDDVTEETLKTAGEMFIYLNSCPHVLDSKIFKSLKSYISTENVKSILLFLNRLLIYSDEDDEIVKKAALAVLNKLLHLKGLKLRKIQEMSTSSSPEKMKNEDLTFLEKGNDKLNVLYGRGRILPPRPYQQISINLPYM